jgi:serine/threonine protein kinase/Tol biopolymer transport system component
MGEVYRARDPRLGREVALKVVRASASEDGEALRRFEAEARATGALNHPNVLAVFDVGLDNGTRYIISELLEGQTLRDKLRGGALSPRGAIDCGAQLAAGLAAAHEKGIVHRDLKPENIFITRDGRVKILDFGLAKLLQSPALSDASTGAVLNLVDSTPSGTILGTTGYMSPEQVRGQPPDARSDIFGFGTVFYEMLSGRRAFTGTTAADTMSAILSQEPTEIVTGPGVVSPTLERIMRHCLEKNPDARFQSARDLRFALETLSGVTTAPEAPRPRGKRVPGWAFSLAIAAGAIAFAVRAGHTGPERQLTLKRVTSDSGFTTEPAVSPDGKLLAYASDRSGEGGLDIWVQQVDGGQPLRITKHPADDYEPSFSPDSSKIVFRSERDGGGLYVVPALGGDERLLTRQGHWPRFSPDGSRIAYVAPVAGLGSWGPVFVMDANGGAPRKVAPQLASASAPLWSPDGKRLLVAAGSFLTTVDSNDWWLIDVSNTQSQATPPIRMDAFAAFKSYSLFLGEYVTTLGAADPQASDWVGNRIVFSATRGDSRNMWEVDVSPKTSRIAGPPRRLTAGTDIESSGSFSGQRLIFSVETSNVSIWQTPLKAADGTALSDPRPLTQDLASHQLLSVADDGRRIAFVSNRLGTANVWLKEVDSATDRALTTTSREDFPIISRDGSRVLYFSVPDDHSAGSVSAISVDGGAPEKICDACGAPTDWSQDERWVLLQRFAPEHSIHAFDTKSRREAPVLGLSRLDERMRGQPGYAVYRGHFSPDERWLLFHVARTTDGGTQEFVAPFHGLTAPQRDEWIAITDGKSLTDAPRWSPNGNLIYYISDRDGFRCLWAQRVADDTKRPLGEPFAVQHLHGRRYSITGVNVAWLDLAVARDKILFNMVERHGNIWMAEFK